MRILRQVMTLKQMMRNLNHKNKAQALLELAIFGSILIGLLGILINYGLRYNHQHRAMQRAFRRAMTWAARQTQDNRPNSVGYVYLEDRHIPNAQDPWGVGSVASFSASASSPVWSYKLDEQFAGNIRELPRVVIEIDGAECPVTTELESRGHVGNKRCYFLAAGFRRIDRVPESHIKKYAFIYGQNILGCENFNASGNCTQWGIIVTPEEGEDEQPRSILDIVRQTCPQRKIEDEVLRGACIRYEPSEVDGCPDICAEYRIRRIRIQDPGEGEVFDYSGLTRICRQIVDVNPDGESEACIEECVKAKWPGSEADCEDICSPDIEVPWYCADYAEIDEDFHQYYFPMLNQLFVLADGYQAMGIQPDYDKETTRANRLRKVETKKEIKTWDTWNWDEETNRAIVFKPYGLRDGTTGRVGVETHVSQDETQKWTTDW